MAHIYADDKRLQKFYDLRSDGDPRLHLYVYRFIDEKIITPYLYSGPVIESVEEFIRDEFGGGGFYIIIRRGKKMELAGDIAIELPLNDSRRQAVIW
ncbi:MAG: hypothetical protein KGJ75_03645 [Alphaproteobacteria bacterium]|nr:hypothetical protein [Alphaproteobacteria bacterium]